MFSINQQKQFLKKMKQSGIPADGLVTGHMLKHPYPEEHRTECTKIFGERQAELTVQITYTTQENNVATMDMHTSDLSAYPVGTPLKVRYLHENGQYLAIPETLLSEKSASFSVLHQLNPEILRKLWTLLLAVGVFAISAGVTVLVIWVWLNR